jgi:hypothetical protein
VAHHLGLDALTFRRTGIAGLLLVGLLGVVDLAGGLWAHLVLAEAALYVLVAHMFL